MHNDHCKIRTESEISIENSSDQKTPTTCLYTTMNNRMMKHSAARTSNHKGKKVKADIALHGNPISSQSYGTSFAIRDHTVLPATQHE